jgi:uncharacterized protein (DUF1800 family)
LPSTATPLTYTPIIQQTWTYKARVAVEGNESPDRVVENWWHNASIAPDQLRQRVAFAYSQIFVISSVDDNVNGQPAGMASFHDMLADDAFVNFKTLLNDVTLHPIMGQYLNMRGNTKQTLPARPNENYAREIMQLFSIGLNLLQPDGTLKLDANGLPIPSYDQTVIQGFAQVFTGWDVVSSSSVPAADVYNVFVSGTPNTMSQLKTQYHQPMAVNAGNHSVYEKDLLSYSGNYATGSVDRFIIQASSQTTTSANNELGQAIDNIFNHPNVGPFICRELIQRLIGSSPSPAYLFRVAQVFANDQYNGSNPTDANGNPTAPIGVRGNMAAVVKAILLDSEARTTTMLANPGYGHLREPDLRLSECIRGTHPVSASGYFKVSPTDSSLGQAPYRAPTVFNFYTPDYSDPGVVATAGLASPELYIANENTNVTYVNTVYPGIYSTNGWPGGDITSRVDCLDPLVVVSGNTTSGSAAVVVSAVDGIVPGEPVNGSGIPTNTTVLAVNPTTLTVTLSQNASATASGVSLTFGFVTATANLTTTVSSATATVSSASGLVVGQSVVGNGNVAAGTYITNISGTTLTLSKNATATASAVSTTFGYGGNLSGIACEAVLAGAADVSTSTSLTNITQMGLLDRLNMQYMGGTMPAAMKTRIATYVNSLPTGSGANNLARARAAVNLVLSSAQFCTEK